MRKPTAPLALALLLALTAASPPAAAEDERARKSRVKLGRLAPWFKLKTLTGHRTWTRKNIQGKPTVLVAGMTQKAAPPCKDWMLALVEKQPVAARVLQVIVVDKAWYLPRSLVLKKIRTFVPASHHGKVLLEWYTVFAEAWGIPKVDDPFIYLLDSKGVVRFFHRGKYGAAPMKKLKAALARLKSGAP